MYFGQWVIFVDKPHLVFVSIHRGREEGRVHAGAIGALQIVKVDHRHFCIRIAANRPPGNIDVEDGIFGEIEALQARQLLVIGGNEKVDDLFGQIHGTTSSAECRSRRFGLRSAGRGRRKIRAGCRTANGPSLRCADSMPHPDVPVPVDWALQPTARHKASRPAKKCMRDKVIILLCKDIPAEPRPSAGMHHSYVTDKWTHKTAKGKQERDRD